MSTKAPPRSRPGEEIWETTTPGTVWVTVTDNRGKERQVKVGGKIGSRLRITSDDREVAEDRLMEVSASPFRNGMLVRIDAGAGDMKEEEDADYSQQLSTEELMAGFAKSGNAFHSFVGKLNEVNTRRMLELAPAIDASASQLNHLEEVVREKYRPATEGPQPSYVEMQRRGEVAG